MRSFILYWYISARNFHRNIIKYDFVCIGISIALEFINQMKTRSNNFLRRLSQLLEGNRTQHYWKEIGLSTSLTDTWHMTIYNDGWPQDTSTYIYHMKSLELLTNVSELFFPVSQGVQINVDGYWQCTYIVVSCNDKTFKPNCLKRAVSGMVQSFPMVSYITSAI